MTAAERQMLIDEYRNPDAAALVDLCRRHIRALEECEDARMDEAAARAELEEMTEDYNRVLQELDRLRSRKWWQR